MPAPAMALLKGKEWILNSPCVAMTRMFDFIALTQETSGPAREPRATRDEPDAPQADPASSPHEGRTVVHPGSRQYDVIYQWIKEGASFDPDPFGRPAQSPGSDSE